MQGLVYCAECGRRMAVAYNGTGRRFGQFMCIRRMEETGEKYGQSLGGRRIEQAVVELFLDAVEPAGVEVALGALQALRANRERLKRHWAQSVERAEYQSELAQRRYEAVDPTNRLVASELESRWNEALKQVSRVRTEADEALKDATRELSEDEQERIRRMAGDVRRIWSSPSTTPRDRKQLLRTAITRVILKPLEHIIQIAVEWKGGEVSKLEIK